MREKQTHTLFFLKKRTKNHQKEQKKQFFMSFFCKARNLTLSRILPTPVLPSLLTFLLFYSSTSKPSVLLKKRGAQ